MTSASLLRGVVARRATTLIGLGIAAAGGAAVFTLGMTAASATVLPPVVSAVTPLKVPLTGSSVISVTGSGFTGATAFTVNAVAPTAYIIVSNTQIVATVDDTTLAAGNNALVVTTNAVPNTTGAALSALSAPTSDGTLSVVHGAVTGGTSTVITGTNLTGAIVKVGSTVASSVVVNTGGTTATVTTPPMAAADQAANASTGLTLSITTAFYTTPVTVAAPFTYDPAIASLSIHDSAVTGGGYVDIKGSGYTGAVAANVTFNGTAATALMVLNDTEMFATVPAVATSSGNVIVTLPAVTGANARAADATGTTGTAGTNSLWYFVNAPTVTAVSPGSNTGPLATGSTITVTGIGFTGPAGSTSVFFGTVKATSLVIVSNTSLTVALPVGAPTVGVADVTVTNIIGTSARSSLDRFLYLPILAPTLTSANGIVDHTSGGAVLITGTGFTGTSAVKAIKDGGTLANVSSFIVLSDTQIIAVLGTITGGAAGDSWSLSATNAIGTSTTLVGAFLLS
jgi:hypothetical protein